MPQPQTPRPGSRPGAMTMAMQAVPIKPPGIKVLRIGLFRDKKIVEERIVRQRETVSVGTAAKNHLIIRSGTLPRKLESRFELFQLVGDEAVYAYQSGMDPERLDVQPGRLSCIAGLRRAVGEGRARFDFLRGDEPYKAQWRATPRPSLYARVVPRKPLAMARHAVWLAGRRAKETIKGGLAALGMSAASASDQDKRQTFPGTAVPSPSN